MAPIPLPRRFGDAGTALWTAIADPVDGWNLRADELAVLARACAVSDRLARLDDALGALDGDWTTTGSMRQLVEHPVLLALVRHEALLQRLLHSLKLPDLGTGERSTSVQARKAAQARWSKPRSG